MGRRRKSNPLNLPERVYAKHGAFYYAHADGRWERLSTDVEIAKRRASGLVDAENKYGSIAYWLDQFLEACRRRMKAGDLAARTLADYTKDAAPIRAYFGEMYPQGLEPKHKADYLDLCLELGRGVHGNREFACLSAMMSWLVRTGQGGIKANPFIRCGVARNRETKRERYVEHEEMRSALTGAPIQVKALAELVYRTLQRPEDIISWTLRNITERRDANGRLVRVLRNQQGKTGKVVDIEITPELQAVFDQLRAGDGKIAVTGMTLIHRRDGKPYTYDGLCAMLKRRQKAAGVASFGYYDLKGKGATDMWLAGVPLEKIQVLCGHGSITTTERYVKSRWRGVVQPNQVQTGTAAV
jgi:integrase